MPRPSKDLSSAKLELESLLLSNPRESHPFTTTPSPSRAWPALPEGSWMATHSAKILATPPPPHNLCKRLNFLLLVELTSQPSFWGEVFPQSLAPSVLLFRIFMWLSCPDCEPPEVILLQLDSSEGPEEEAGPLLPFWVLGSSFSARIPRPGGNYQGIPSQEARSIWGVEITESIRLTAQMK